MGAHGLTEDRRSLGRVQFFWSVIPCFPNFWQGSILQRLWQSHWMEKSSIGGLWLRLHDRQRLHWTGCTGSQKAMLPPTISYDGIELGASLERQLSDVISKLWALIDRRKNTHTYIYIIVIYYKSICIYIYRYTYRFNLRFSEVWVFCIGVEYRHVLGRNTAW